MTTAQAESLLERARQVRAAQAAFIAGPSPTARIIALFDDIRLAFIATDKVALGRRAGWLGRLLGRDIDIQAEAELLRAQGPLLVHRADELAREWDSHLSRLEAQCDAVTAMQSELDTALGQTQTAAADAIRQRLQQMRLLFDLSAAQNTALRARHRQLGRRFAAIRAGLLPMLAQTGIVDAAHRDQRLYADANDALQSLERRLTDTANGNTP
ncbi:hypothetical protein EBB59_08375 [Lysobacter pythonis]|uniref:Uncharacterized protein n=1 Tax=Solilutibacter pythonis TaxID=2483112 RepID=A0A3M2HQ55_9GAMM|nr:hypothetical protein [Lysobacter pythonis]RMH91148.1 hypothetical protein EBB59_08375 [Lysobacter pythonis]